MRVIVLGFAAAALAGCSQPVRDIPIAGLDFADGKTLASLQSELPLDDRGLLGTYALLHWPKSKFYCGQPIGGSGPVPNTVGEAIDQTRAYEVAFQLAQAKERRKERGASWRAVDVELVARIERLVLERDMLRSRASGSTEATTREAEIKTELARLRFELDRARAQTAL